MRGGYVASGPIVSVNASGLTELAARLHAIGPEAEAALPAKMLEAAEVVATAARAKAPGSVGSDVVAEVTGEGLARVRATTTKAIAIENAGKGFVRHPVYGNRQAWTTKNSHPAYLHPAFEETKPEVFETVVGVIHDAWEAAGMGA